MSTYNSTHTGADIDYAITSFFAFQQISVATELTSSDNVVECIDPGSADPGNYAVTLPSVDDVEVGHRFTIKNTGTGTITISPVTGELIDGEIDYTLSATYETVSFLSNGTDWIVIGYVAGV